MQPVFSIVVNCRNGETYLREALDSIYAQTFQSWEIIFYDNGSTDSSLEIANSYDSRLKIHKAEKSTNLGEARFNAVNMCAGKYLCFLDVDDVYCPEKLQRQLDIFNRENVVMVSGGMDVIDGQGLYVKTIFPRVSGSDLYVGLLKKYQIFMCTVAIDLAYMRQNNYNFDKAFTYSPDYKLFMTIAQGANIHLADKVLSKYRTHGDNLSNSTRSLVRGQEALWTIDYLRKSITSERLTPERSAAFKYAEASANVWIALDALDGGSRGMALRKLVRVRCVHLKSILLILILIFPLPLNVLKRIIYWGKL